MPLVGCQKVSYSEVSVHVSRVHCPVEPASIHLSFEYFPWPSLPCYISSAVIHLHTQCRALALENFVHFLGIPRHQKPWQDDNADALHPVRMVG